MDNSLTFSMLRFSLEETYEALRTFEVIGIDKKHEIRASTCQTVVDTLGSSSSALNDVFQALRANRILNCELNDEAFSVCKNLLPMKILF